MKKSRILAAAMASIVLTGALASCGKEENFESENNANVCVYGPPPSYSDRDDTADREESSDIDTGEEEQSAVSQGD